ncbi:hypothetical protein L3X38_011511 [Prunus dulcis]|uniref:Ankyrin repeat family protein n=1 Tax=Prunus dulcis TaxID=3755 RepID=A0AAD4WHN7_PRUDU|nr:hypothetical protein L3X38_011511 [Prunus dulcis]
MLFCATDFRIRRAKLNKFAETTRASFFPSSGFPPSSPSLSAVTSALSLRSYLTPLPAVTSASSLPSPPPCRRVFLDFSRFFAGDFSLLRPLFPTPEMSDLIRRGRSMTTAPSSDPPALSASAATAPALLDHVVVGPGPSQAPASSVSSVAQPASARRRHRPTDTIETTSTDGTGASESQPVELHSSLAHDIGHVVRTHCPMQWKSWRVMPDEIKAEVRGQLSTNYNLEDLDEESLTYVNRLFAERYKQWKSDLHHHFQAYDDPQVALQEVCPKELEGREDSWEWLWAHFQAPEFVNKAQVNQGCTASDEYAKPQLTSYHYTFCNLELGVVPNHEDFSVAIELNMLMQRLEENLLLRCKDSDFLEVPSQSSHNSPFASRLVQAIDIQAQITQSTIIPPISYSTVHTSSPELSPYYGQCHTPDRLRSNTILSSLGRAYPSDPQGFVLGSSRSNFPGWSPILGLLQPPTRLTSEFPVLRSQ